jgi:hypothetical protein
MAGGAPQAVQYQVNPSVNVDTELVQLTPGLDASQAIVAYPSGESPGNDGRVTSYLANAQITPGTVVYKTGITTGTTEATVTGEEAAGTYNGQTIMADCANGNNNHGDSGAPVWTMDNNGNIIAAGVATEGIPGRPFCFLPIPTSRSPSPTPCVTASTASPPATSAARRRLPPHRPHLAVGQGIRPGLEATHPASGPNLTAGHRPARKDSRPGPVEPGAPAASRGGPTSHHEGQTGRPIGTITADLTMKDRPRIFSRECELTYRQQKGASHLR